MHETTEELKDLGHEVEIKINKNNQNIYNVTSLLHSRVNFDVPKYQRRKKKIRPITMKELRTKLTCCSTKKLMTTTVKNRKNH